MVLIDRRCALRRQRYLQVTPPSVRSVFRYISSFTEGGKGGKKNKKIEFAKTKVNLGKLYYYYYCPIISPKAFREETT